MAVAMALPLRDHPDILKLLDLMEAPDYQSERQGFMSLLDYTDALTNQYNNIMGELADLKERVSGITDRKNPLAVMVDSLMSVVSGIGEKLKALKDSIVEFATNTLDAAKDKGLSALGAVSEKLHIHEGLEAISKGLGSAAAKCESLEQFHQERVAVREAANEAQAHVEEAVSLSDLLGDLRMDFENLSPDELKATYDKLLDIGMNNDLSANELNCLQYLTESAESLLPDRGEDDIALEVENELDIGEEI
jgi:hypothetical protein